MKPGIDKLISNGWIECCFRWILGGVFIYASIHKIIEPAYFAKIIYGYQLFPAVTINILAIIVPYLELFAGIALVLGIWPRSSAIIINTMLLLFMIAISINLIRGHEFDCGCFSFGENAKSLSGGELLVRDILWFTIGTIVITFQKERKFCITGSQH